MTDLQKTIAHYKKSSDEDWRVAQKLFHGSEYAYALFFCHLALEKMLKAAVMVRTGTHPAYTHFLLRLAEDAGIPVHEEQIVDLKTITKFNIAGRYDDDKRAFRKLATRAYAQKYLQTTHTLLIWLKKDYLKRS